MKFTLVLLVGLVATARAQYFSEGWSPDADVTTATIVVPTAIPTKVPVEYLTFSQAYKKVAGLFDLTTVLGSAPSVALFSKFGINITERIVQAVGLNDIWDPRIPLITDKNYAELIVNETLTAEEEANRVWFIVISTTAAGQVGISKMVDEVFDATFNETFEAQDLRHVKFGRIDYLNVTEITTKWAIWQAPYLVVLKDRGQTLRFYRPQHLRIKQEALRAFLQQDGWKETPPWSTAYSPGGEREYILDYFAKGMAAVYNILVLFPRWLLVLVSGTVASFVLRLMHTEQPAQPARASVPPPKVAPAAKATAAASPSKRGAAAKRKNAKK